jgi:hypothetical protein
MGGKAGLSVLEISESGHTSGRAAPFNTLSRAEVVVQNEAGATAR